MNVDDRMKAVAQTMEHITCTKLETSHKKAEHRPLMRQLLWFFGLWVAGFLTVSLVALVIKAGLGV